MNVIQMPSFQRGGLSVTRDMLPEDLKAILRGTPVSEMLAMVETNAPNCRALAVPKKLRVPPGFSSPEQLMICAFSGAWAALHRRLNRDKTTAGIYASTSWLIKYQVPTFFVSAHLCDALLHTKAPEDMLMTELPQPLPAMLFMLPEEFSMRYFGTLVPFITVCFFPPLYETHNPIRVEGFPPVPQFYLKNEKGNSTLCVTMLSWEENCPLEYDTRAPLEAAPVANLMTTDLEHFAYLSPVISQSEHDADNARAKKMNTLAINLILGMTAEPGLITREHIIKPAKKKDGKVIKPAIWQPNMIGQGFRVVYESKDAEGSHASPHAHWRVGHWRNQRSGPKLSITTRIWIRPVFVGLKVPAPSTA